MTIAPSANDVDNDNNIAPDQIDTPPGVTTSQTGDLIDQTDDFDEALFARPSAITEEMVEASRNRSTPSSPKRSSQNERQITLQDQPPASGSGDVGLRCHICDQIFGGGFEVLKFHVNNFHGVEIEPGQAKQFLPLRATPAKTTPAKTTPAEATPTKAAPARATTGIDITASASPRPSTSSELPTTLQPSTSEALSSTMEASNLVQQAAVETQPPSQVSTQSRQQTREF